MEKRELDGFTGSEHWYKHLCGVVFTDGVQYLAERGRCYWLLDLIASYQPEWKEKALFQIWKVKKEADKSGWITMKQDSNRPIDVQQHLEFMDFPFDEFELYCINGVILLKSEY